MLANKGAEIILVLDGMMKPHGMCTVASFRSGPWKTRSMCSWPIGWARATGTRSAAKARWPIRSRVLAIASTEQPQALTVTLDMDAVDRARSEFRYVDLAAIALDPARRG